MNLYKKTIFIMWVLFAPFYPLSVMSSNLKPKLYVVRLGHLQTEEVTVFQKKIKDIEIPIINYKDFMGRTVIQAIPTSFYKDFINQFQHWDKKLILSELKSPSVYCTDRIEFYIKYQWENRCLDHLSKKEKNNFFKWYQSSVQLFRKI